MVLNLGPALSMVTEIFGAVMDKFMRPFQPTKKQTFNFHQYGTIKL